MQNFSKNSTVWFLIVIVFIALLVVFTRGEGPAQTQNMVKIDGLDIKIVQEGTGAVAEKGNLVSVNYTGKFKDGTVFDSNIDPKFAHVQPLVFPLGQGMVIKGWDEGIVGMKVGEKRILEVDSELGYGAQGFPGAIPPDADLIFEVELLAVTK